MLLWKPVTLLDVPPRASCHQDGPSLDELRERPGGETQDKTCRSVELNLVVINIIKLKYLDFYCCGRIITNQGTSVIQCRKDRIDCHFFNLVTDAHTDV
ncbi:Phosphoribosylformylglycinamidine synthase subunit PurL [Frankliniella fusca]|uniref:Phosphoribosylformylglycinamidine synthase subunit PurL n=1 Tax=Frankliniella fusca TaxID=407009 RepID=A0AAE1GSP6_9NEOP|nr:Phosphoribosylformylglycinamidine synthase subunit PurL [Frankliniella fusca]